MKALYFIASAALTLGSYAQTTKQEKDIPVTKVTSSEEISKDGSTVEDNTIYNNAGLQTKPEFPGGMTAFSEFILSNFNDPIIADGPKTLKTYISFVVEKDGSVTDIRILRDPGYGIGEEAKRVLKLSPNWKPGEQNEKPVRAMFNLPLTLNIPAPLPLKSGTRNTNGYRR